MSFNWRCPYCLHDQVVISENVHSETAHIAVRRTVHGDVGLNIFAIGCANSHCRELSVRVYITPIKLEYSQIAFVNSNKKIVDVTLMPESGAKPQPDYIPTAIRLDYIEACRILYLSPKASATLSRRCLQGMIRDFTKVVDKTLYREIVALDKAVREGNAPRDVSIESVNAIDNVRVVGNIGAHMEADVNYIIDVEPDEAQLLIELIEMLFEEWYIERKNREERYDRIAALATNKEAAKQGAKSLPASPNPGP